MKVRIALWMFSATLVAGACALTSLESAESQTTIVGDYRNSNTETVESISPCRLSEAIDHDDISTPGDHPSQPCTGGGGPNPTPTPTPPICP